jgi:cytochrome c
MLSLRVSSFRRSGIAESEIPLAFTCFTLLNKCGIVSVIIITTKESEMRIKSALLVFGVWLVSLFWITTATAAPQMPEIVTKAACITCHAIDKKLIGPAWSWVAYKYKDDKGVSKKEIMAQIANGGKGRWTKYTGGIMMPPMKAQTTEAQRAELADFILNLDPVAPPDM